MREPSLNGHHDPAELEKKRHLRKLAKQTRKSLILRFGVLFGILLTLLIALALYLVLR